MSSIDRNVEFIFDSIHLNKLSYKLIANESRYRMHSALFIGEYMISEL